MPSAKRIPKVMKKPIALALLLSTTLQAQAAPPVAAAPARPEPAAEPALESASSEVREVARWVAASRDNGNMPYLVIDKVNAQVFLFSPKDKLLGAAPALLGMARGDQLLAANGAPLEQIRPFERITPAGRFL